MLEIRRHKSHDLPQHGTGIRIQGHTNATDACNALLRISDTYTGRGWTAAGGGYILYLTSKTGREITYRIHKA